MFFLVQYITSKRGKLLILCNGYTYFEYQSQSKHSGKILKKRWICSTHYPKGCRATIVMFEDEIVSINDNHTHSPLYNSIL
ncbi:uncharacterized protein [Choristoneura fumiferana]|uniref:uncharacterized protein n=1 Tax=Choristoneura fumiferana TaxID=7141 RepID=UPI003D153C76